MDLWVRVRDGECNLGIPKVHDLLLTYLCYEQLHRRFHNQTHMSDCMASQYICTYTPSRHCQ